MLVCEKTVHALIYRLDALPEARIPFEIDSTGCYLLGAMES